MLRVNRMVPRWFSRRSPAIRHRGVPLGKAGRRGGARQGNVRRWLLLGGWDWNVSRYERVRKRVHFDRSHGY